MQLVKMALNIARRSLYALKRCENVFPPALTHRTKNVTKQAGLPISNVRLITTQTVQPEKKVSCIKQEEGLTIEFVDQTRYFSYYWLRDNCRAKSSYNHDTFQKIIVSHQIDPEIKPTQVKLENETLLVQWPEGLTSTYKVSWLMENSYPGPRESIKKFLWDAKRIEAEDVPRVPYKQFIEDDDEGLEAMLRQVLKYGFSIVDGAFDESGKATVETTERAALRISDIWKSVNFPKCWILKNDRALSDTSYSNEGLKAHTDGTSYFLPPGFQVFHCLKRAETGGDTLLVDGFHAAESLRQENPKAFRNLTKYSVESEYKESLYGRTNSLHRHTRNTSPIIRTHPETGELEMIRHSPNDIAPIRTIPPEHLKDYYRAYNALSKKIDNPEAEYWIKMEPGMILFADNWRLLHGRSAYTGYRELTGCYLGKDDVMSRTRCLGLIP